MTIVPGTPEARRAAEHLRAAAEKISAFMDDGRDKTDVLRRLGMMIANLTEHDRQAICRRCQNVFSYNAARFRSRGLSLPRHCYYCRQAKRNEHEQTT